MPNVPKDLLEKMPSDAEIVRLLNLKPTDAERKLGYERPADCVMDAADRPADGNRQYVGVVTIDARKFRIWQDRIEDVYAESAPRPPVDRVALLKNAVARGVYWDHDRDPEMMARCTRSLMELVRANRIAPVVHDRYELNDLPRALEDPKSGRSTGKLILNADRGRPSGR